MSSGTTSFIAFLAAAHVHLDDVRDADRALKVALRLARRAFGADEVCLAVRVPGKPWPKVHLSQPAGAPWDGLPFAAFLAGARPRLGETVLMAAVARRERPWGIVALRNRTKPFPREAFRDAARVGFALSRTLARIDEARMAEVRERIDRKLMEQMRPQDLFYQVLHGLRTLTRYDHSAAILTLDDGPGVLEVVAEQITWHKGKSEAIGRRIPIDDEIRRALERGHVLAFDRVGKHWEEALDRSSGGLVRKLDFGAEYARGAEAACEGAILCAPLATRDGLLGVIKVASCHPGSLGAYEARLVRRFLPEVGIAVRNLERTTSLESGMLAAERKHALATLARGVSHDVNNAFGSVLPLVQQLVVDARAGALDPEEVCEDLEQVEASLQVCRRIFSGMLDFGREGSREVGEGDVRQAWEATLAVLEESLRRASIEVVTEGFDEELPHVRGARSDLEQLFLNIAGNARDAMPEGGELHARAECDDEQVRVTLRDTGVGIPAEDLAKVKEPFWSTKRTGSGLGLSICRSVVWKIRGRMTIASTEGVGTTITLQLPLASLGADEPGEEPDR